MKSFPSDWSSARIDEIASVKTGPFGSALHESDYAITGTPIVTVEHLGERGIRHTNLPLVGDEDVRRLSAYICRPGDILFSRVGSIDRNSLVSDSEDGWLFSGRLLRVRTDTRRVHAKFLSYVLSTAEFKDSVRAVAVGQTMPSLNTKLLGELRVSFPDLGQQRVSAETLGDADTLISSIERLIAKKQAIKQGMMQQLLTGKTRLPGFSDEWIDGHLSDVLKVKHGRSQHEVETANGMYPILGTGGVIGWTDTPLYSRPSVLIGRKGTIDRPQYRDAPFWTVDTLFYTEVNPSADPRFLYFFFTTVDWRSMNEASGVPSLNSSRIASVAVRIPPLEEQLAIASVLRDCELEIEALQHKLTRFIAIKQGMMQELLSGRTRLQTVEVAA